MCKIMEDMRKEAVMYRNYEVAKNLLKNGKLSLDDIVSVTGLTSEDVEELKESISA